MIGSHEDKFETTFFLFEAENRKGEGGLRTQGYFKHSYKKIGDQWYIADTDDNPIALVDNDIINSIFNTQHLPLDSLPLVSIITVVYNGEKYLEETIKSVIGQSYPNIEYIIIDGGSMDGTLDIIKKYEHCIDYWVSERDEGIYDAMNKGLTLAFGKFIGILNADDYYMRNGIVICVERLMSEGCDYVVSNVAIVETDCTVKPIFPLEKKIYQEMPYPHIGAVIGMDIYKSVGLFDTRFKIAGDHDMAVRIILADAKACLVPVVIGNIHEGGISDSTQSNREFMQIAIKHGKSWMNAKTCYHLQIMKVAIAKLLPNIIVQWLQKMKKSRFA